MYRLALIKIFIQPFRCKCCFLGADLACHVRSRRSLDSRARTQPFHVEFSRYIVFCQLFGVTLSNSAGFSIGIGLTYPLCGFLIAHLGWRSVFYTTGSVGVIWCGIWYLLAFDSPETHPRISLREQRYIQANTVNTYAASREQKVPWMAILKSPHAWAIGVTTFGRIWVHYTFIIPGPKYMKSILGFSIEKVIDCFFRILFF